MTDEATQVLLSRTPGILFKEASLHEFGPVDLDRIDELHGKLAPLVDEFKPTHDELLSVLATFLWSAPYTRESQSSDR